MRRPSGAAGTGSCRARGASSPPRRANRPVHGPPTRHRLARAVPACLCQPAQRQRRTLAPSAGAAPAPACRRAEAGRLQREEPQAGDRRPRARRLRCRAAPSRAAPAPAAGRAYRARRSQCAGLKFIARAQCLAAQCAKPELQVARPVRRGAAPAADRGRKAQSDAAELSGPNRRPQPFCSLSIATASAPGLPDSTSVSPSASTVSSAGIGGLAVAPAQARDAHLQPRQRQPRQRLADGARARRQGEGVEALVVDLVGVVVVGAVEVAAQQVVARVALVLHDADHAPHRHADQRQRMAGQHQRALDRLRHHLGRAGRLQLLEVAVVLGAHDHRHLRRMGARVGQHLERARHVLVGHDQRAGARQAGGHQRLQPRRIAEHHRVAGRGGLPHAVRVQVQRQCRGCPRAPASAPGSGRSGRSRR